MIAFNFIKIQSSVFRLFGACGNCAICKKTIPGFELVMKAKGNNYHLDCFACQFCKNR